MSTPLICAVHIVVYRRQCRRRVFVSADMLIIRATVRNTSHRICCGICVSLGGRTTARVFQEAQTALRHVGRPEVSEEKAMTIVEFLIKYCHCYRASLMIHMQLLLTLDLLPG